MMNRLFLSVFGLMAAMAVGAQTKDGGITSAMLQQIEQQQAPSASDRALRNALAANAIDLLAKNQQHAGELDTYFRSEIERSLLDVQWIKCIALQLCTAYGFAYCQPVAGLSVLLGSARESQSHVAGCY